ncbi:hypothetical protein L6R52_37035, partial [Myxococcota bacterium]|nr:hypothetical protein [Myxococcota bacterium]
MYWFVVLAIAVLALGHTYFWLRLFRDPGLSRRARIAGAVALALLGASVPLVRWLARTTPREVIEPFELVAYVWMGAAFFLFVALVAIDLLRAVRWIVGRVQLARAREPVPAS